MMRTALILPWRIRERWPAKPRKTTNYMGADVTVYQSIDTSITSKFVGYDKNSCDSKITVLTTDTDVVEALTDGQEGTILTEETPFYATSGGQVADTGVIRNADGGVFEVKDTIKLQGGRIGHVGKVVSGMFYVGDAVTLEINEEPESGYRKKPQRNPLAAEGSAYCSGYSCRAGRFL